MELDGHAVTSSRAEPMHTLTREEELALESNVMRVLATRPSDERTSAANKATLATPPQGGAEIMRPVKPMVATLSGHFKPTPATEKQKQELIARRARASRDAYEARALSHNGSGPRMRRMRKHAVRVWHASAAHRTQEVLPVF